MSIDIGGVGRLGKGENVRGYIYIYIYIATDIDKCNAKGCK